MRPEHVRDTAERAANRKRTCRVPAAALQCGSMDAGHQPDRVAHPAPHVPSGAPPTRLSLRGGDITLYQWADTLTEGLIYFAVVFSPWAFGTTQPWAIGTMNLIGYLLGGLLAVKWFIRRVKGYRPPRWEPDPVQSPRLARRPAL